MSFDPIAKEWDAFRKKPSKTLSFFLPFCKGTVLDAGCGNGRNALALCSVATHVDAVDVSSEMVKNAEKNTQTKKNVTVTQAGFTQIPFGNGRFKTVFCLAAFHHVPPESQEKVLHEFLRVLKPGGILCLSVWNKGQLRFREKPKEANVPWRGFARYYYFFEEEELEDMLERSGLTVVETFYEKNGKKSSMQEGQNLCVVARKKKKRVTRKPKGGDYSSPRK